jgi:hypothetical protein
VFDKAGQPDRSIRRASKAQRLSERHHHGRIAVCANRPTLRNTVRFRLPLLFLCSLTLIALSGCSSETLPSSQGYILAQYGTDGLSALPSDDPLYQAFDRDVMSDPVIARLLSLFDGTCGGFAATNLVSPNTQTLGNYLVVVIGARRDCLLKDVQVHNDRQMVQTEHAVALAVESDTDLSEVRDRLRELLAQFLLVVTGQDPPETLADLPGDCTCVAEEQAFWHGYAILQRDRPPSGIEDGVRSVLDTHDSCCCPLPPAAANASEDCVCARGIAGLLAELSSTMPLSYPQRYMLWFANYEPGETRDAKLLLAFARIPRNDGATLDAFVRSYADTFPSEADLVRDLAQVWRARMDGSEP